ncbi:hypothetical protein OG900_33290 [Streptomyces sp. NBC_00433]
MSNPPTYRALSEQALSKTAAIMQDFPEQGLPLKAASARFEQAQVIATVAVAQALLDIGDVLREGFTRTAFDVEVD